MEQKDLYGLWREHWADNKPKTADLAMLVNMIETMCSKAYFAGAKDQMTIVEAALGKPPQAE